MGFLKNLKLKLSPPRISDDEFGELLYMHIPADPKKSYWECEWKFPITETVISIGIPGGEEGPAPEGREFFLGLIDRFDWIVESARPKLEEVHRSWLEDNPPEDIFSWIRLSGFGVEDLSISPLQWNVSFETTGDQWLSVTIPFAGNKALDPVVDT